MADLRKTYKKRTLGFGNVEDGRILRVVRKTETRKKKRSALFANNRNISGLCSNSSTSVQTENEVEQAVRVPELPADRRTRLIKWKAQRALEKEILKRKKLPLFRTGTVSHKLDSPVFLHKDATKSAEQTPPRRVTRATEKRLALKLLTSVQSAKVSAICKTQTNLSCKLKKSRDPTKISRATDKPSIEVVGNKSEAMVIQEVDNVRQTRTTANTGKKNIMHSSAFAPDNYQFKGPEGLTTIPLFGRAALEGTASDAKRMTAVMSPYIAKISSKTTTVEDNLGRIKNDEDFSDFNVSRDVTPIENDPRTAKYFSRMTDNEVARLKSICDEWSAIKSEANISEEAEASINQAIGQTNLLVTKKIQQFRKLTSDCQTGNGERAVTCDDLQGFWDMMRIQVEDCDARFRKLYEAQKRNWEPEELPVSTVAAKKIFPKKKIVTKTSSIRNLIRAARRKKIESQLAVTSTITDCVNTIDQPEKPATITFDGGFFVVESPKKIVTPKHTQHPRQHAQFMSHTKSESNRRSSSAFCIMRVSNLCKRATGSECHSDDCPSDKQTTGSEFTQTIDDAISEPKGLTANSAYPDMDQTESDTIAKFVKNMTFADSSDNCQKNNQARVGQEIDLQSPFTRLTNLTTDSKSSCPMLNRNSKAAILPPMKTSQNLIDMPERQPDPIVLIERLPDKNKKSFQRLNKTKKENENPDTPSHHLQRPSPTRKSVRLTGKEREVCVFSQPIQSTTHRVTRCRKNDKTSTTVKESSDSTEINSISSGTLTRASARINKSSRIASKCVDS